MSLLAALAPKKPLRDYMLQYKSEHTKLGTKLTHMVGIPMIVASFPAAIVSPPVAGALFVGGWALQFIGHGVFEKQKPSFLADPFYLMVGPVWVAIEWAELLHLPLPDAVRALVEEQHAAAPPHATNGASHEASAAV